MGYNIVSDIYSGSICAVDDLTYNILGIWKNKNDIYTKFQDYSREDINTRITEIETLEADGLLFSKSSYKMPKCSECVTKALCLNIAHTCNLECGYCFANQGSYQEANTNKISTSDILMNFDTAKRCIDFVIARSLKRKNIEIDFFGGEPLLNFDLITKVIDYAKQQEKIFDKHFMFTLTTNGLLLDKEKIRYINENIYNVVLSLDGRKEIHDRIRVKKDGTGSYEIVVKNFQELIKERKESKYKDNYYVRGTFTNFNKDFVNDFIHMHELGFEKISLEPVVIELSSEYAMSEEDCDIICDEYDKLAKLLINNYKRNERPTFFHFTIDLDKGPCFMKRIVGCGSGLEYLAITPNGDVFPCHQFVGIDEFKMGNINSNDININTENIFTQCNISTKKMCDSCWAKFYCSGGCHANAYRFNKNIFEPYELQCKLQRKRIECAIAIKVNDILHDRKVFHENQ
jgi:uncharacterized protein